MAGTVVEVTEVLGEPPLSTQTRRSTLGVNAQPFGSGVADARIGHCHGGHRGSKLNDAGFAPRPTTTSTSLSPCCSG